MNATDESSRLLRGRAGATDAPSEDLDWFAVRIVTKAGPRIVEDRDGEKAWRGAWESPKQIIESLGYRTFNPHYEKSKRLHHRRAHPRGLIRVQVLPGYLFVGMAKEGGDWLRLRNLSCVCGVVGVGNIPRAVEWSALKNLQSRAEAGEFTIPTVAEHRGFQVGDTARILEGPFRGFETTVQTLRGKHNPRALVLFHIFGNENIVEIHLDNLQRATHIGRRSMADPQSVQRAQ